MKLVYATILSAMMAMGANASEITIGFDTGFVGPLPTNFYAAQGISSITCEGVVAAGVPAPQCHIKGSPTAGEISNSNKVIYEFECGTDVRQLNVWSPSVGTKYDLFIQFASGATETRRLEAQNDRGNWFTLNLINVKIMSITRLDNSKTMMQCFLRYTPPAAGCPAAGGGGGDPHFFRWTKDFRESFHGECDLVMAHSDNFHGAGLDLHVRTTIDTFYSYIEAAAVRIGDNILEVSADKIVLNGEETKAPVEFMSADGKHTYLYHLTDSENNGKKQIFSLEADNEPLASIRFYQHYLTVSVSGTKKDFHDAQGLLGKFEDGSMVDRVGAPFNGSFEAYAFEWQVNPLDGDPRLFMDAERSPQLPFERCYMPTGGRPARRLLRANNELYEKANAACSAAVTNAGDLDLCIDDVMMTGEVGLAEVW